jgi:hypothetical protein
MGNSTLPAVSDKFNVMASIHNRKFVAALAKKLKSRDSQIQELIQSITSLENKLNDLLTETRYKEDKQMEPS